MVDKAALSADNILRIYECIDLERFTLADTVDITALDQPQTLDLARFGLSISQLSAKAVNGTATSGGATAQSSTSKESEGSWSLSWCKEQHWGQVLAVTVGTEDSVKVSDINPPSTVSYLLTNG